MSDGLVNLVIELLVGIVDAVDLVSEKTESGKRPPEAIHMGGRAAFAAGGSATLRFADLVRYAA